MRTQLSLVLCWSLVGVAAAAPPANRIPKPGVEVPEDTSQTLQGRLAELDAAIEKIQQGKDPRAKALLCDVRIYQRAVAGALEHGEFFNTKEFATAETLLAEGLQRAAQLADGKAPWTAATGLVVRGYVSRIDGSVQPYGLVLPESYTPQSAGRYRLDIWFHGRGETRTELNFIQEHRTRPGQFTPADTIVLHPFGRYCNAFKFAGEVDVFEALEAARSNYRVDSERVSVRGFSMGGAATWHFAVHHADRWFAANPGAGFAETAVYTNAFAAGQPEPPWYEQVLWRWYDCPPYARNLYHCPTIAYSGELDKQKAAADLMATVLAQHDITLAHVIGPKTEHKYHPTGAAEVERRLKSLARYGRDQAPLSIQFDTPTLKYNRMYWVTIDGLEQHWELASVDADCLDEGLAIDTVNVTDLTLEFAPGDSPFDVTMPVNVMIDNEELTAEHPPSDRSWRCALHRVEGRWRLGERSRTDLHKRHDLQGPIDDAFMNSFVFVRPSEQAAHPKVDAWARSELDAAIDNWRRYFRGQPRVRPDTEITDQDIAEMNLVLWGDPASNAVLKRIADKLPIRWAADEIAVADRKFPAEHHALVMIYPNPLNPDRYVVLNSGFTFPDSANASNAKQTPKLPDWAVIDLDTPRTGDAPGGVVMADFFGEQWDLHPARNGRRAPRVAGR